LEFVPPLAFALVRAALRFPSPTSRLTLDDLPSVGSDVDNVASNMAVTLAVIDLPWAHSELKNALADLRVDLAVDLVKALPLVLALRECTSESAAEVAQSWIPFYDADDLRICIDRFQSRVSWERSRVLDFAYHSPESGH
jgi:hypothetical protein